MSDLLFARGRRRVCLGLLAGAGLPALRPVQAQPQVQARPVATRPRPHIETSAQQVRFGRLERWLSPPSRFVAPRPVEVWLPPGYDGRRPHAVLYMHDGQMLFDPATTWNRQAWQLDQVAAPLLAAGRLRDFIVVAPWNNGALRHAEYYPQGFLDHLQPPALRERFVREALAGRPLADDYLRFLVEELKPAIDAHYATAPGRDSSFLMGSSMGGLISVYGLCRHPEVFGAAAALSTHWIGIRQRNEALPAAALAWLAQHLPAPQNSRLYMDRGTEELDALYDEAQDRVDALMRAQGFAPPGWISRVYHGAGHKEQDWQARLDQPLRFLLGTPA